VTDVTISALVADDVGDVARIHRTCFDEAWDPPTIRKILTMPGAFGLVARSHPSGEISGFALARVVADECELLSLGVDRERRRCGIGGGLFDAAIIRACAQDAARFFLEVAEDNAGALQLYRARGLVPVGRRPGYYRLKDGTHTAALTMRCELPTRDDRES
jgi:ribosomal-protein-alanine N-acetyltransferase